MNMTSKISKVPRTHNFQVNQQGYIVYKNTIRKVIVIAAHQTYMTVRELDGAKRHMPSPEDFFLNLQEAIHECEAQLETMKDTIHSAEQMLCEYCQFKEKVISRDLCKDCEERQFEVVRELMP